MISVDSARQKIESFTPDGKTVAVPFDKSTGRVLATHVTAPFPQPRFDNSAMDGFALKSSDILSAAVQHPVTLKSLGVIAAGKPLIQEIRSGHCAQIMTGGKIPPGADAVVMVENTSGFNSLWVKIYKSAEPLQNIRMMGEELPEGELLCSRGSVITAAEIGIFATFGMQKVKVFRRPKISLFGPGDELIEPGQPLYDGQIYNSNLHVLKTLIRQSGADLKNTSLLKDDPAKIESFLRHAISDSDIIISSGGISMGRFDYTRNIFEKLGVREHFWKVAQKPGKPLFFGTLGEKLIFGLPGNPVSTVISFFEYVYPLILKMTGRTVEPSVLVPLAGTFPVEKFKHRFLFGKCSLSNHRLFVEAATRTGSHMLTSFLNSNCIIGIPPMDQEIQEGTPVPIRFLPNHSLDVSG